MDTLGTLQVIFMMTNVLAHRVTNDGLEAAVLMACSDRLSFRMTGKGIRPRILLTIWLQRVHLWMVRWYKASYMDCQSFI